MRIPACVVCSVLIACGTSSESASSDRGSASDSGDLTADAAADTGVVDAGEDVGALADASFPRCMNSTYTTAPSGAACDPSRIVGDGIAPHCAGITEGTFCDSFAFSVPVGVTTPAGFICTAELGQQFCHWQHGDGGAYSGSLESVAIEQACAVTISNPTVQVSCTVYE